MIFLALSSLVAADCLYMADMLSQMKVFYLLDVVGNVTDIAMREHVKLADLLFSLLDEDDDGDEFVRKFAHYALMEPYADVVERRRKDKPPMCSIEEEEDKKICKKEDAPIKDRFGWGYSGISYRMAKDIAQDRDAPLKLLWVVVDEWPDCYEEETIVFSQPLAIEYETLQYGEQKPTNAMGSYFGNVVLGYPVIFFVGWSAVFFTALHQCNPNRESLRCESEKRMSKRRNTRNTRKR